MINDILSFSLVGLKSRCIVILVKLSSRAKDMTITLCHNKPPDRKWGWSVVDIMPGRDGPKNLRILKKSHLRLDHGGRQLSFCHWSIEMSSLPLRWRLSFQVSTDRDLKHNKMCHSWWGQHIKNCDSLLVSKNQSQEIKKSSYLNNVGVIIITQFLSLSLPPNSYHYHYHPILIIIITTQFLSLSLSPNSYHYHYHPIFIIMIITQFLSLSLSPNSFHDHYHPILIMIIITQFLSLSLSPNFYHYHNHVSLIITIIPKFISLSLSPILIIITQFLSLSPNPYHYHYHPILFIIIITQFLSLSLSPYFFIIIITKSLSLSLSPNSYHFHCHQILIIIT